MAEVHLPPTLPKVFADLPRTVSVEAGTVAGAIAELDTRWPGLGDRLCEPGPVLRKHINVYVDQEQADLAAQIAAGSRVDIVAAISGG